MASIDLPQRARSQPVMSATAGVEPPRKLKIEFSGTGGEYFRIWIVNILLSILTLGIYSAWAKVRNKQYFYGSSNLDGASFEYTANPVNILKGRILVVAVLLVYQFLATFAPGLAAILGLGFLFVFPWVVVQALSFNARYSSHRGLSFHFDGRYGEAASCYILWTLLAALSAGVAYPYAIYLRKRFILGRSRFGATRFKFGAKPGFFYMVYVVAAVIFFGLMVGLAVIGGGIAATSAALFSAEGGADEVDPETVQLVIAAVFVGYMLFFGLILGVSSVVQTLLTNHIWQHATAGEIRFDMQMKPMRVLWIQLSNVALIILSVGLLIPWAKVRITRYRLSCFSLFTSRSLDTLIASDRDRLTATGEEFGEALDLDLGL